VKGCENIDINNNAGNIGYKGAKIEALEYFEVQNS